ncbi:MAG: ATP-binding cassette domain-containing protein [Gammaproteobacteria bacterium]|nr:ATP-binding cassette domain-containing protein [Gammaproteobacteria bacterium]
MDPPAVVPGLSSDPIAEARNLHFAFTDREVFRGLDLAIPRGRITVIMGPSGCGKSTFLGLLGGRLRARSGELRFGGEPLPVNNAGLYAMRRKMGMLFQNSALLTDLNVFENVAFPLREQTDLSEELIRILVLMMLEMVGLRGARDLMPSELSGGMSRRVSLARAIVLGPQLIMYDEPFVGLDPISMGVILQLIHKLNTAMGITSVVVTHDVTEGCSIADYVYLLDDGRVVGHGVPEEMMNSEDPGIRQFMDGLPDGPVGYHYPATDYLEDLGAARP